jgi:ribosomal protein L6P/L9E
MQIFDITHQIKKFRKPDIYKGVGIKYPNEIIKLKKGKVRQ